MHDPRTGVARGHGGRLHEPQRLPAADLGERGGERAAVGRDIEVVEVEPVGERPRQRPVRVGRRQPHERRDAVEVPHRPQRARGAIERQVADAGVVHELSHAAGRQVQHAQVAPLVVVGGEEQLPVRGIERERRHEVERRALHLVQHALGAAAQWDRGQVRHGSRPVDGGEERVRRAVHERARHRAERQRRQVARRRGRE